MEVIDVAERLLVEFEGRFELDVIAAVVARCQQDLAGTPNGPMPELLERLARQRLLDASTGDGAVPGPRS